MEQVRRNGRVIQPFIYECFGLPGAGKSTVVDRLIHSFCELGWRVSSQRNLMSYISAKTCFAKAVNAVCNPHRLKLATMSRHMWGTRPMHIEQLRRISRLPIHDLYLRSYLRELDGACLWLHQWTVQAIWSTTVGVRTWSPNVLEAWIANANECVPRHYIYIDIGIEEAARRIELRQNGDSRFDSYRHDVLVQKLKSERERMEFLVRAVQRSGASLLWINGEDTIGSKVDQVISWVSTHR